MKNIISAIVIAVLLGGCSAGNIPDIKNNAEATFSNAGFNIVGYEGYVWGTTGQWGGCAWYIVEKKVYNGVTYHGCISKWGSEYHIYTLSAIDAIRSK